MRTMFVAAMLSLALGTAAARADAAACDAPAGVWGPFAPLTQVVRQLDERRSLVVVALGSSSTYGTGATSRERSYPAQLGAILRTRFPQADIQVINAGVGGETVALNLARLDRDVLAHRPDLVIWQVGTNDAFQKKSIQEVYAGIRTGIARLRAAGAEVVLMEAQYFPDLPDTDAQKAARAMVRKAAQEAQVAYLPRYTLMQHWIEARSFLPATMIGRDKIHMTDASYRCLAERVADLFPPSLQPEGLVSASAAPAAGAAEGSQLLAH
jgi:acyl-CoA thioesterase-1